MRLRSELTDAELQAAQVGYPNESFEAGIGEQLVAAEHLLERYDDARQGAEPHAAALVQAAIDWVRMDVGRPIRLSELATLYPLYLRATWPTLAPKADLDEALAWACDPAGARIALLHPAGDDDRDSDTYLPFDYLVGIADGQHDRSAQPILDVAWDRLTTLAVPSELQRAATSAFSRRRIDAAKRLVSLLAASEDTEVTAWAVGNLGVVLKDQGDLEGARAAYQQAIDTGDPKAAPAAMVNLGALLVKRGDLDGARAAFEQAIDTGHRDQAPKAMVGAGVEFLTELRTAPHGRFACSATSPATAGTSSPPPSPPTPRPTPRSPLRPPTRDGPGRYRIGPPLTSVRVERPESKSSNGEPAHTAPTRGVRRPPRAAREASD